MELLFSWFLPFFNVDVKNETLTPAQTCVTINLNFPLHKKLSPFFLCAKHHVENFCYPFLNFCSAVCITNIIDLNLIR